MMNNILKVIMVGVLIIAISGCLEPTDEGNYVVPGENYYSTNEFISNQADGNFSENDTLYIYGIVTYKNEVITLLIHPPVYGCTIQLDNKINIEYNSEDEPTFEVGDNSTFYVRYNVIEPELYTLRGLRWSEGIVILE